MLTLDTLIKVIRMVHVEFPAMQDLLRDIYAMAEDEIEDGGSEAHEVELAIDAIRSTGYQLFGDEFTTMFDKVNV